MRLRKLWTVYEKNSLEIKNKGKTKKQTKKKHKKYVIDFLKLSVRPH